MSWYVKERECTLCFILLYSYLDVQYLGLCALKAWKAKLKCCNFCWQYVARSRITVVLPGANLAFQDNAFRLVIMAACDLICSTRQITTVALWIFIHCANTGVCALWVNRWNHIRNRKCNFPLKSKDGWRFSIPLPLFPPTLPGCLLFCVCEIK